MKHGLRVDKCQRSQSGMLGKAETGPVDIHACTSDAELHVVRLEQSTKVVELSSCPAAGASRQSKDGPLPPAWRRGMAVCHGRIHHDFLCPNDPYENETN